LRTRQSSDPRTQPFPAAAVQAWGFGPEPLPVPEPPLKPPAPNPAGKTLLSWGLGAFSLVLLVSVLAQAWPTLFPGPQAVLKAEVARATNPEPTPFYPGAARAETPAPRALPVDPRPAPRAQPVPLAVGATGFGHLPDGRWITVTNKGLVPSFGDLPKYPALGDQYTVTEGGAKEGVCWIWYTPLGWNHPAWIDP
jgi:hypothetical protein